MAAIFGSDTRRIPAMAGPWGRAYFPRIRAGGSGGCRLRELVGYSIAHAL